MLWQAVSEFHASECPDEESGQHDERDDKGIIHGRGSLDYATALGINEERPPGIDVVADLIAQKVVFGVAMLAEVWSRAVFSAAPSWPGLMPDCDRSKLCISYMR
jgi:hypothetical protein